MKKFLLVGFLVLALLLASCGPSYPPVSFKEYYSGTWLVGEHNLRYMERSQALEGNLSGNIFFVAGSLSTEPALTFAWEPKPGNVVITTLPLASFSFIIDETKTTPTIELVFYESTRTNVLNENTGQPGWGIISPGAVKAENPNNIIPGGFDGLKMVIVRISTATLEREIYLPH